MDLLFAVLSVRCTINSSQSWIWIRYTPTTRPQDITASHVFDWQGRRYRVLDAINVEDRQRYTRVSVKDLGAIA